MTARPWMKFYPPDWRADPALRMCSYAARGFWMEMLCLMHEATPRGFLVVNGKAVNERQLASLSGGSVDDVRACLAELLEAGVYSVDEQGTIFSRRMVRETERSVKASDNGKMGGNPILLDKREVKPEDKGEVKTHWHMDSSNRVPPSTTAPTEQEEASTREVGTEPQARLEFDMEFWPAYPHKVAKVGALTAFIKARKTVELDAIMAGVARYAAEKPPDENWMKPETFLANERWLDERAPRGPPARQQRAVNGYAALALEMAANEPDRPYRPDQASGPGPRPQQGDAYPRLLDAEQPRRAG